MLFRVRNRKQGSHMHSLALIVVTKGQPADKKHRAPPSRFSFFSSRLLQKAYFDRRRTKYNKSSRVVRHGIWLRFTHICSASTTLFFLCSGLKRDTTAPLSLQSVGRFLPAALAEAGLEIAFQVGHGQLSLAVEVVTFVHPHRQIWRWR